MCALATLGVEDSVRKRPGFGLCYKDPVTRRTISLLNDEDWLAARDGGLRLPQPQVFLLVDVGQPLRALRTCRVEFNRVELRGQAPSFDLLARTLLPHKLEVSEESDAPQGAAAAVGAEFGGGAGPGDGVVWCFIFTIPSFERCADIAARAYRSWRSIWRGARRRTRAARSVPRPRTSRPRGDRRAWRRGQCKSHRVLSVRSSPKHSPCVILR